jgi:hypothetical protein
VQTVFAQFVDREKLLQIESYCTGSDDQSCDQLMQSANLTYDQVRNQTRNLCIEGLILSYIGTKGEQLHHDSGGL